MFPIQASNFVSLLSLSEHLALPPTHQEGSMSCYLVSHIHLSTPITIPISWREILLPILLSSPPTHRLYLCLILNPRDPPHSCPPYPGPLSPSHLSRNHCSSNRGPSQESLLFFTLQTSYLQFSKSCRLPPHTSAFLSDFTPCLSLQPTWHSATRLVFFKILLSSCHHFAQNPIMFLCL